MVPGFLLHQAQSLHSLLQIRAQLSNSLGHAGSTLRSSHHFSPVRSPRNCPLPCLSDIIVYPLVCPFKHLPSGPHALCTQARQLSLPTLCSLNYQVPCSVSLLILVGRTSLSDRVFTVPRGNHYLFPKGDLFYPLTFPQKLLYNLLQGFSRSSLKPPESRSWVWARNSQCIVCHF